MKPTYSLILSSGVLLAAGAILPVSAQSETAETPQANEKSAPTKGTEQKRLRDRLPASVFEAPAIHPAPEHDKGNIRAIFYDTLDFEGKPTRAFAYLGIPESDKPVPAMVLVHGGGGTAFHDWVKIWNDRGYAAISMSLEGQMPAEDGKKRKRHDFSGPARKGSFNDRAKPLNQQWMYHAVADVVLANSLLRSLPEVDAERIGMTGISWGGIISSLTSGVDDRFKCVMPVYGAGYLHESKGHFKSTRKNEYWNPHNHFIHSDIPTLWVNGDGDAHFSVNITSRSFELTKDHAFMTIHPNMKHGHPPGFYPTLVPEIYAFANHVLKGGPPLGKITVQPSGREMTLQYESPSPIQKAVVHYLPTEIIYERPNKEARHSTPGEWKTMDATVDSEKKIVTASLPEEVKTYYVNLEDERGHVVSSIVVELK